MRGHSTYIGIDVVELELKCCRILLALAVFSVRLVAEGAGDDLLGEVEKQRRNAK